MSVIALIEDPAVVRAILTHLGLWQPQALERAPPAPARAWPEHANLPLTYHPPARHRLKPRCGARSPRSAALLA